MAYAVLVIELSVSKGLKDVAQMVSRDVHRDLRAPGNLRRSVGRSAHVLDAGIGRARRWDMAGRLSRGFPAKDGTLWPAPQMNACAVSVMVKSSFSQHEAQIAGALYERQERLPYSKRFESMRSRTNRLGGGRHSYRLQGQKSACGSIGLGRRRCLCQWIRSGMAFQMAIFSPIFGVRHEPLPELARMSLANVI